MTKDKYIPESLEDALEVIDDLKADNAKLRRQKGQLKEQLAEYGDDTENVTTLKAKITELEGKLKESEDYKAKYEELDGKYNELNGKVSKAERLEKLKPIFNKLNVTDEKALALALKEIGEDVTEDKFEESAKAVVEAYPLLASKPVKSVPDTGKSNEGKANAPVNTQSKLAQGIAERIANTNN